MKHGTHNAYKDHRCRCDKCRTFMSHYMRTYRLLHGAKPSPPFVIFNADLLVRRD